MRINKGDRVRITIPSRFVCGFYVGAGSCEGTVLTADNWKRDGEDNWYIELEKDKVSGAGWQLGYGYWKQAEDGGKVEKL